MDMFFSIRIRFMSVEFMVIPSLDKSFSRDGLKDLSHTWSTAYHQYIKNQSSLSGIHNPTQSRCQSGNDHVGINSAKRVS